MTEAEWEACADPTAMLEYLCGRISDRKHQLFACACCRRLLGLFLNAVIRQVVEFGERDADQLAGPEDLFQAEKAVASWLDAQSTLCRASENTLAEASAVRIARGLMGRRPMSRASLARYTARDAAAAVRFAANDRRAIRQAAPEEVVQVARTTWQAAQAAYAAELQAQAALLRDIAGDPFRPAAPDPALQRPEVAVFADIIYERQTFERLPELGELLEEVGCTDHSLLAHCRQESGHVRGCWVVDLILGKS